MSEKSELPTPKRLADARKQGQFARSRLLTTATSTLAGVAVLAAMAPGAAAQLRAYAAHAIGAAGTGDPVAALWPAAEMVWRLALPAAAAAFVGALVAAGLQVGIVVNPGAISPRLDRVSPAAGMKRVCSKQSLVELLRSVVTAAIVVWIAYAALRDGARAVAALPGLDAPAAFRVAVDLALTTALRASGAALALGALDYLRERGAHLKRLMMSKDEVKREHKEAEGDPRHKAKRKAAHRALLNGTAARGVQHATAVVLNPTHIAVALRYEPGEAGAPTIVAKGTGEEAAKIRALARRLHIPMVRDIPLARALVRCDVGDEIPEELYRAAAVVLRHVFDSQQAAGEAAPSRRSS